MNARELFEALAPLVAPALEKVFRRRDFCVIATRVVIDVAEYYGIEVRPLSVRAIVYNAQFAKRLESGAGFTGDWQSDGSYSVGIGFGEPEWGKWAGHLIATADGMFADYSIAQAERPQHGIITGDYIVGPIAAYPQWTCENEHGTVVEYRRVENDEYKLGPDWRDPVRRRPIVGALIRAVRNGG